MHVSMFAKPQMGTACKALPTMCSSSRAASRVSFGDSQRFEGGNCPGSCFGPSPTGDVLQHRSCVQEGAGVGFLSVCAAKVSSGVPVLAACAACAARLVCLTPPSTRPCLTPPSCTACRMTGTPNTPYGDTASMVPGDRHAGLLRVCLWAVGHRFIG